MTIAPTTSPAGGVSASVGDQSVTVTALGYTWSWSAGTDEFQVRDPAGRLVVSGTNQPAIVGRRPSSVDQICAQGVVSSFDAVNEAVDLGENTEPGPLVTISYRDVNGKGSVTTRWRFHANDFRLEPVEYENPEPENVVRIQYFSVSQDNVESPGLRSGMIVQPGIAESSSISPVIHRNTSLDMLGWLGRGSSSYPMLLSQQWGLPVHYFCGMTVQAQMYIQRGALTELLSDAFCCGLAVLPDGDLLLQHRGGNVSPVVRFNGDLWNTHSTSGGPLELGAGFCWTLGRNYDDAIRSYYRALVSSGHAEPRIHSSVAIEVMSLPQFNTWGAQMADGPDAMFLTQDSLEQIYDDYRSSGSRPECSSSTRNGRVNTACSNTITVGSLVSMRCWTAFVVMGTGSGCGPPSYGAITRAPTG